MTVHLPEDVENAIRAEVISGHFASEDALVATAVRDYLRRKHEEVSQPPVQQEVPAVLADKPIWERILERSAAIPEEEWNKLPVDGAEQHDHYVYGTPKRPSSS